MSSFSPVSLSVCRDNFVESSNFDKGEKTFKEEFLEDIDESGDVNLIETSVSNGVKAGGGIKATNSDSPTLDAEGSITIETTSVFQRVQAGGSIEARECNVLGNVQVDGSAKFYDCPVIHSITAGGHVLLQNSFVLLDVTTSDQATVIDTTIKGKLSCVAERMIIENSKLSTIDTIEMKILSKGCKQTLELKDCVVKNVIFEGGSGEVVLEGESGVIGGIIGGVLKL